MKEIVEGEDDGSNAGDGDDEEEAEAPKKFRKITPNIQDYWIKLVPDMDQFINALLKTF